MIPIVLGLIISATTSYLVDGLGYAVGLMFADYYMFRRLSYMDPDTGFFNERYLEVLLCYLLGYPQPSDKEDAHSEGKEAEQK